VRAVPIRKRDGSLAAQYRRLVKRRGDKKAIVAVAHNLLVIASPVLRNGVAYRELGGDYFDHLNADRLTRYHTRPPHAPLTRSASGARERSTSHSTDTATI
jgi:hypothetical protein